MRPEQMDHRPGKGLVIIHSCLRCGFSRANRIASDTAQPDDLGSITSLMRGGPV